MTTNQLMFLYAAEELNFTRAAERAFVTQQCLSTHIRVLEEKYQTRLFDRRPKIALTENGKKLYQAFLAIKNIEDGIQREMSGNPEMMSGEIRLGVPFARAQVLLPEVFTEFRKHYPGVTVHVTLGSSRHLAMQLTEGRLDLSLGVNMPHHQELAQTLITEDAVYLLASDNLLHRFLPEGCKRIRKSLVILPDEISRLPLAVTPVSSTVKQLIDQYFVTEQIVPDIICAIDSYDTALSLCRMDQAAFLCPESILLTDSFRELLDSAAGKTIQIIKPDRFTGTARIELLSSRRHYLPGYVSPFGEIFVQRYQERIRELRASLVGHKETSH